MSIQLQPFPYQGSKRNTAVQIAKYFPKKINRLIEPFAGSAAITLYAAYHRLAADFIINDSYKPIIDLWNKIIKEPEECYKEYNLFWKEQLVDPNSYYFDIRKKFNEDKDPVKFLYLLNRCAKNAVRFNSKGEFNQSPDKRRLGRNPDLLRKQLISTSLLLNKKVKLLNKDFDEVLNIATSADLVYMDPPYQGTSGVKNPRYHQGLNFDRLMDSLKKLNKKKVPFLLSYDGKLGNYSYGKEVPKELGLKRIDIHAGRSAQATLNGKSELTVESLYISPYIK